MIKLLAIAAIMTTSEKYNYEEFRCIRGVVSNSLVTSAQVCEIPLSRVSFEINISSKNEIIDRATFNYKKLEIFYSQARTRVVIRSGKNGVIIRAKPGMKVELFFDRPFRLEELGYPVQTKFSKNLNPLWELLDEVCLTKKALGKPEAYGLTKRELTRAVQFAKQRFIFYKGNCNMKLLYPERYNLDAP